MLCASTALNSHPCSILRFRFPSNMWLQHLECACNKLAQQRKAQQLKAKLMAAEINHEALERRVQSEMLKERIIQHDDMQEYKGTAGPKLARLISEIAKERRSRA